METENSMPKKKLLRCPNCGEDTISKSEKFWLGPIRSVECFECEAAISIPYGSLFYMTLWFAFIYIPLRYDVFSGWYFPIIIVSCIPVTYGFYKLVPLIVKHRKDEKVSSSKRMKNVLIGTSYFIITMAIVFFMMFGEVSMTSRRLLVRDLNVIHDAVEEMDYQQGDIIGISDNKLYELIKSSSRQIRPYKFREGRYYDIYDYMNVPYIDGLNALMATYEENKMFSEEDMIFYQHLLTLNQKSAFTRNKETYKLSWNIFKKLQVPESVEAYYDEIDKVITNYTDSNN